MEEKVYYYNKRKLRIDFFYSLLAVILFVLTFFLIRNGVNWILGVFFLLYFIQHLFSFLNELNRPYVLKISDSGIDSPFFIKEIDWSTIKAVALKYRTFRVEIEMECDFIVYEYEDKASSLLKFKETKITLNLDYVAGNEEDIFEEIKTLFENNKQ